ncbi:VOC family protein [Streptomyces sp. NPDC002082]|uniref:VOC family protein n=1 Tax=Streptomyces sp. NPDC002082 TaxID=3154772 RepID=UPI0033195097
MARPPPNGDRDRGLPGPGLLAGTCPDPARPQQFHMDFGVADLDQAQERVLAMGATVLDDGSEERSWRIYADPAGHPFCLVRH